MNQLSRSLLFRYAFAVLVTIIAFVLSLGFQPMFTRGIFALFYISVLLSAYYGGLGPAFVSMFLGALGTIYFLIPPANSFEMTPEDWVRLGLFAGVSVLIALLTAARERTNRSLGQERERLRVTLASIGDAVIVADIEGCVTFMNGVAQSLTGWTEQDAAGQTLDGVFKIVNETTRASAENPVQRVLREGRIVGLANHTVLIARDGREIPIDDSAAPIRDARGKITGVVLIFRDISARRTAEQALRASEERFRALIENISDAIALLDAEGIIRYASPSTEHVLGYKPEEYVGHSAIDYIHRDDQKRLAQNLRELVTHPGTSVSDRFRYRHRDGTWRWIEGVGTNLLDHPSVRAIVANYRDVTRQLEDEAEIRRSRDQLDVILHSIAEGITVQAPDGSLIFANDMAAHVVGFDSAEEMLKAPVAELTSRFEIQDEAGNPFPLDHLPGRLALQGRPGPRTLVRFRKQGSGEEHWSQVEATPIFDGHGQVQFAINIFREITERKRAEQRLNAQYAVTRILAQEVTLDQAVPRLLEAIGDSLAWDVALLWNVDRPANVLRYEQGWHSPRVQTQAPLAASREHTFEPGIGLPGWAWAQREPVWIPDITQESQFLRTAPMAQAGLRAAFAFPISLGGQVLGVIELFSAEIRQPDPDLLALGSTLGGQLGQFVERTRAEEALRDSEDRIRTIAETASDGILTVDSESTILFVNPALAKMFGYAGDELLGQKMTRLMPPEQRDLHLNSLRRYIHTHQKRLNWERVQFNGQRRDGTIFPLELSLGEFVKNGKHFFTGVLRDISQRREVEEQLRFQANVLQNVRDSVIVADLRGRISYWNEGATRLFGYTDREMLGQSVAKLYPDRSEEELLSDLQVILEGQDYVGQWRGKRKDDRFIWVDIKTTALRSAAGKIIGFIVVARDITEQIASDRALRESEERFRSLSANSPLGIFLADVDGNTTYTNPAFRAMGGVPPDDPNEFAWDQFVHPEDRTRVLRAWQSYTREGAPYLLEYRMRTLQGSARWLSVRASPLLGNQGQLIGHVGTVEDITERKQATEALESLVEASNVLASTLDYETTLKSVARLMVPQVADWCVIDILDAQGQLRELEIAHKDPAKVKWGWDLRRRYPIDMNAPTGVPNVLRTGQPELISEITDEMLVAAAGTPEDLKLARDIGFSSVMMVPLTARGRTLGVVEFVNTESGRHFGAADLALAQELARRAALAVDNSRLYQAEQTARRAAEQSADRTARLQAVTAELSQAVTPEQVAAVVVNQGLAALGADAGYMTSLDEDGQKLNILRAIGYPPDTFEARTGVTLDSAVPLADAVRRKEPIWLESPQARVKRYPDLGPGHFSSAFAAYAAIPLLVEGRVLGGMGLSFAASRALTPDERNFILTLARQSAQALERARLFEAEKHAHAQAERTKERLAFLADASKRLAGTLDYDLILSSIASLVTPRLADWSTVDVLTEDGSTRMAAWAHVDPAKADLIQELHRLFPLAAGAPYGYPYVIRTGVSTFVPYPGPVEVESVAPDASQRALIREIGYTSHLCVPLTARGRTFGAITLNMAQVGHCFTLDDLALAEEFARRAALALDNARLYRDSQTAIGLRDQFMSIASHELKTPLTSLSGYAELLQRSSARGQAFQERDRRAVNVIAASSGRLTKLINTMLDVSRIETGQMTLDREPIDLRPFVKRLVEESQLIADQHEIRFTAPPEPLVVDGDELRLEQVLQNLITNAIKYSPQGGPVNVRLERRGENACLIVQDYGIGIPASALPNLFSRFYRVQNGKTRHISGMGVGLYVVKEIVNLHGGSVTVESREGVGSTFTVCLPLKK